MDCWINYPLPSKFNTNVVNCLFTQQVPHLKLFAHSWNTRMEQKICSPTYRERKPPSHPTFLTACSVRMCLEFFAEYLVVFILAICNSEMGWEFLMFIMSISSGACIMMNYFYIHSSQASLDWMKYVIMFEISTCFTKVVICKENLDDGSWRLNLKLGCFISIKFDIIKHRTYSTL